MRILIIEDDRPKLTQLSTYMNELLPNSEIAEALSYNSGLNTLLKTTSPRLE